MGEPSSLERRLIERATIENDCEATADLLREAAAAIAELREACELAMATLIWIDAQEIEEFERGWGEEIEVNRKALAGLARGGEGGASSG